MRKRFISLFREETAKGTYFTSKALTYKSSTSKSCILSSPVTLIRVATLAIALTSEYERIRLAFAATLILDLTSLYLALIQLVV